MAECADWVHPGPMLEYRTPIQPPYINQLGEAGEVFPSSAQLGQRSVHTLESCLGREVCAMHEAVAVPEDGGVVARILALQLCDLPELHHVGAPVRTEQKYVKLVGGFANVSADSGCGRG